MGRARGRSRRAGAGGILVADWPSSDSRDARRLPTNSAGVPGPPGSMSSRVFGWEPADPTDDMVGGGFYTEYAWGLPAGRS